MENQQQIIYQRDIFIEHKLEVIDQLGHRNDVNGARTVLVGQVDKETNQGRAFTGELIGIVCSTDNINRAYKQVKKNKGVAGIDNIPVGSFADWFSKEGEQLVNQILRGEYLPSAVKAVEIPKPSFYALYIIAKLKYGAKIRCVYPSLCQAISFSVNKLF